MGAVSRVGAGQRTRGRIVFVLPGQGGQWEQMALELLESSPCFAEHMRRCEVALSAHVKWSVSDVLRRRPRARRLRRVDVVQPVLFAVSLSLAELWRECGVQPDSVAGHSQSEVAAACFAGALSLEQAAMVIARRTRVLTRISGKGAMAVVSCTERELCGRLERNGDQLVLAGVNAPSQRVVSGAAAEIRTFVEDCRVEGVHAARIAIDYASHSPQIEPLREEMLAALAGLRPAAGEIPLYSSSTGGRLDGAQCDAEHWYRAERELARFQATVETLLRDDHDTFLEIGPHPVLASAMQQTADVCAADREALVACSLRREQGGPQRMLTALAELEHRVPGLDWELARAKLGISAAARPTPTARGGRRKATLRENPGDAGERERRLELIDTVMVELSAILGEQTLGTDAAERQFRALGLDSAGAVELRNRLQRATGRRLATKLLFEHTTPAALADHLSRDGIAQRHGDGGAQRHRGGAQRQRSRRATAIAAEPIAIVGAACRFPGGVDSPEKLWELLDSGGDAVGPFPTDRGWDLQALYDPTGERPGTTYAREGGFLYDAAEFDEGFFDISPREAAAMDPQQRLFLEACWEAVESAGMDARALRGGDTGVFAGINTLDYNAAAWLKPDGLEGYRMTGAFGSVIAGRVSYVLGLHGPALTVDTACSSSLVCMHLAASALRRGECDLALAGGVSVMATPALFTAFSRQHALARDGRCKSFAKGADGTGWGEGVGVLTLERLTDAERSGRRVLALLRGSAVNQDGASNGLTAPNGLAQQQVIHRALLDAGIEAADVDAVEAHGTGTTLGDPIEAEAVIAAYCGEPRGDAPLRLGSVKSNIGHTQAAAGVASAIKIVMALQHERLPKTLHADAPTPEVDWPAGEVELLTEAAPWPKRADSPRRAGVSSYGISGTNAHVIIEEAPAGRTAVESSSTANRPAQDTSAGEIHAGDASAGSRAWGAHAQPSVWMLSARSAEALDGQANRLGELLAKRSLDPADIALSLAMKPTFEHRAVIIDGAGGALRDGLDALSRGVGARNLTRGARLRGGERLAILFTGQGAQRVGMGAELYAASPVFAEAFDEVAEQLDRHLRRSLGALVFGVADDAADALAETQFTQASLFALEVALYRLLASHGVAPDFLIGHSIGELTAAFIAGVFSLDDACELVAERGRLMGALPRGGAMVAIEATEQELADSLQELDGAVAIAAINGPSSVVLSGEEGAVAGLAATWREHGRKTRPLRVSHAFHSPLMDPMLDRWRRVLERVELSAPAIPIVSNVTGEAVSAELCDVEYWVRHVREPVRFGSGIQWLHGRGVRSFLELGPDGVLSGMAQECLGALERTERDAGAGIAVPVLRGTRSEQRTFCGALAEVWTAGVQVDWRSSLDGSGAKPVSLPSYAFQRRRHWIEDSTWAGDAGALGLHVAGHPLLGAAVAVADGGGWLFTGRLSLEAQPWLGDHAAMDVALLPGTALLELATATGVRLGCGHVRELTLQEPLTLAEQQALQLQVELGAADEAGARTISIHSRRAVAEDDAFEAARWACHATGLLAPPLSHDGEGGSHAGEPDVTSPSASAWPPDGVEPIDTDWVHEQLAGAGFSYGPAFQGLRSVWRDGEQLYVEAALPESELERSPLLELHPALLDAALHPLGAEMLANGRAEGEATDGLWLPFAWEGVELRRSGAEILRLRISPARPGAVSLRLWDSDGLPIGSVDALVLRQVSPKQLRASTRPGVDALFTLDWPSDAREDATLELSRRAARPTPIVLGGRDGMLAEALPASELFSDPAALAEAVGRLDRTEQERVGRTALLDLLGEAESPRDVRQTLERLLALMQSWLAEERLAGWRLCVLTRSAVACEQGETVADLAGAAAWGFVRSAESESPGRFALIDVDGTPASWQALAPALGIAEPQIALRAGVVATPRLVRLSKPGAAAAEVGERPVPERPSCEGTAMITGGTGALGASVAEHLAAEGARHLLLVSRRGPQADGAEQLCQRIAALGAEVSIVACDVSDREQLQRVLEQISPEHPLRTVIHAAGVLDDGMLGSQTPERLERVLAPKLDAAWHLHVLTSGMPLAEFVMFSSAAGVLGTPGQANYAAANAFLDALAARRRAEGLPATSIAWGLWQSERGMGAQLGEVDLARMARMGMASLSTGEALQLLDDARCSGHGQLVAMALDVGALRGQAAAGTSPSVLRGLVRAPLRRAGAGAGAGVGSFAEGLGVATQSEREERVRDLLRAETASVLGHDSPERVDMDAAFKQLGFDSLAGIDLRNRLARVTGLRLPATLVFDHPSPTAVALHLLDRLRGERPGVQARGPQRGPTSRDVEEPIAIVAMSCRYPGGIDSPQGLWDLVAEGRDAVGPFPADRGWDVEALYDPDPDRPGTSYAREGGFLYDAAEFDADFFGIPPREALAIDPHQRLLLELSWEAIERAGIAPGSLRGSDTGVFAGVMYHDYGARVLNAAPEDIEAYIGIGSAGSVVSGRVAYTFGFEGPAVSVDTACSSSLLAVHLACQALRSGECALALAGGVTVLSTPSVFVEFSRQRGLSPDGRCKSFSDAADGTGWGEGAGLLLLQPLSAAVREGREVLATVIGSAVNQDGASNGLTAPNGPSQQRVIRRALAAARVTPDQIDAVEGHGTGTTLGDPIEAQALLAVYGEGRSPQRPLWLGSVKSNIGHAQAAAGVAGVIKSVMALRNGTLPRTLHVEEPSREVDWSSGAVRLLREQVPWQRGGEPRRAGVSSFGISGTNVHLIVEEAPPRVQSPPGAPPPRELASRAATTSPDLTSRQETPAAGAPRVAAPAASAPPSTPTPWTISAKSQPALHAQAARLARHLHERSEHSALAVGYSLASTRSVFAHRAVVLGEDRPQLLAALTELGRGARSVSTIEGVARDDRGGLAMMFTGQGAQRPAMGRELYLTYPTFRAALEEACSHLDELVGLSLATLMFGEGAELSDRAQERTRTDAGAEQIDLGLLDETRYAQPALFAFEVALFRLLERWGLRPAFLTGHSVGEIVAAHLAGVLSLDDACTLVAARGRLMGALPRGGAMVALQASEQEALQLLAGLRHRVALAAVNGPGSVVVSGDEVAVLAVANRWALEGRKTSRLRVSHAFHSPHMDGMLEQFSRVAEGLSYKPPQIAVVSNLTGREASAQQLCSPDHWVAHVRETVRFGDGVRRLLELGAGSFLEIGPDSALSALVQECLMADEDERPERAATPVVPAMRAGGDERECLAEALARIWVAGGEVDWSASLDVRKADAVELPTYAFQRQRFWLERGPLRSGEPAALGQDATGHPLLGAAVALADGGGWVFTGSIGCDLHPWLGDHVVTGSCVLPGSAMLDLAWHVGRFCGHPVVAELMLQAPLRLRGEGAVRLQVAVARSERVGAVTVAIHSRPERGERDRGGERGGGDDPLEWTCHASGTLLVESVSRAGAVADGFEWLGQWPPAQAQPLDLELLDDRLVSSGLEYGRSFQGLSAAWRDGEDLFAEVVLDEREAAQARRFGLHPVLLDVALHALAGRESFGGGGGGGPLLPFSWSQATLLGDAPDRLRVRLSPGSGDSVSLAIADGRGRPVALVGSLTLRAGAVVGGELGARAADGAFRVSWVDLELAGGGPSGGGSPLSCLGGRLGDALHDAGVDCEVFGGIEAVVEAVVEAVGDGVGDGVNEAVGDEAGETVGDPGVSGCLLVDGRGGLEGLQEALQDALVVLQGFLAEPRLRGLRLAVLTEGAVATEGGEEVRDLVGAAVGGLVRSAQLESPGRLLLVDVDGSDASWQALGGALAAAVEVGEPQLALREGGVRSPRLSPLYADELLAAPPGDAWRLEVDGGGDVERLELRSCDASETPLAEGQARVRVCAAGLNFSDVLIALDMYPGRAVVGNEGAGVVLEVGSDVQGLAPGDRVMGLLPGAFGAVAVADSRLLVPVPPGWTFEQAASVPMAFATAYYALVDLACLRRGERVLIHAAAGGVGIAAVQIARLLGAEVFGTASEGKWGTLRALGIEDGRIASSRTPDFGGEFLRQTGGEGVDVVLDCLAGELVDASLALLPRGGRFLEMGKTDVRDREEVARDHVGVAYRAFDLMEADPGRLGEILVELLRLFERGELELEPIATWSVRRARQAFTHMRDARHVGKNVLVLPHGVDTSGTVLITGGTGGLGALVARHLVAEHGARRLLLVSRGGPRARGAEALVAELAELGARAGVRACDVSDREQLRQLLASVPAERQLSAVVHAAGVLDDGVISSLSPERLARALGAKALGAWHLHELTSGIDLRSFLLFSSMAGTFGSAGQGNYAAANAFLDALASHRHSLGLPATSMAWGLWSQEAGMAGALGQQDLERMARTGVLGLDDGQGLALFDLACVAGEPVLVPVRLDMAALGAEARNGELPALLRGVVKSPSVRRLPRGSFAQLLAQTDRARWEAVALDLVRRNAAQVLGHRRPEAIEPRRPFKDLGFDSLASVVLRNRIAAETDVELSAAVVFDHPTSARLAEHLLKQVGQTGVEEEPLAAAMPVDTTLEDGQIADAERSRASVTLGGGERSSAVGEPVAIVGMSCRYPGGVDSPEELWRLVAEGRDAIGAFPQDRGWDLEAVRGVLAAGEPACGGFLYDAAEFDAGLFGISPREARAIDPQQRLLL
ncbi:MAG: SDR family NAD(P)-dependent oxidoreductase, partial [Solirubrobacteraceae bacterium]